METLPDYEPEQTTGQLVVPTLLLVLELYHALSHFCILFRVRMLPRRDLVRVRYYFLVDMFSVTFSAWYTRELLWLAVIQNMQHVFYFTTWNHAGSKRIIDWSSLDWLVQGPKGAAWLDLALGTAFDMSVHFVYIYYLSAYVSTTGLLCAIAVDVIMARAVLFNSNLAWSNPGNIPDWVRKRVQTIK